MKTTIASLLLIVASAAVLTEATLSARHQNAVSTEPPTVSSRKSSSVSVTSTAAPTGSSKKSSSVSVSRNVPSTEPPKRGSSVSSRSTASSTTSAPVSASDNKKSGLTVQSNNKVNDTQSRNRVTKITLTGNPDTPAGNKAGVSGRAYKVQAE